MPNATHWTDLCVYTQLAGTTGLEQNWERCKYDLCISAPWLIKMHFRKKKKKIKPKLSGQELSKENTYWETGFGTRASCPADCIASKHGVEEPQSVLNLHVPDGADPSSHGERMLPGVVRPLRLPLLFHGCAGGTDTGLPGIPDHCRTEGAFVVLNTEGETLGSAWGSKELPLGSQTLPAPQQPQGRAAGPGCSSWRVRPLLDTRMGWRRDRAALHSLRCVPRAGHSLTCWWICSGFSPAALYREWGGWGAELGTAPASALTHQDRRHRPL